MKRFEYKHIVNFDDLPRIQDKRNNGKINWNGAVGMSFPFMYEGISSPSAKVGIAKMPIRIKATTNIDKSFFILILPFCFDYISISYLKWNNNNFFQESKKPKPKIP